MMGDKEHVWIPLIPMDQQCSNCGATQFNVLDGFDPKECGIRDEVLAHRRKVALRLRGMGALLSDEMEAEL